MTTTTETRTTTADSGPAAIERPRIDTAMASDLYSQTRQAAELRLHLDQLAEHYEMRALRVTESAASAADAGDDATV